jgi:CheY-like chemotaxis protein
MTKRGILIIEDNVTDGLVIKRTLARHISEEITIARDGLQALSFFSQHLKGDADVVLPRLITLDLNMPKMNGFELLERIKENENTKDIPIIILTSSQLPDEIKRAYRLGANSYVIKPTDHAQYERTIERIYEYWFEFSLIPQE